MPYPGNSRVLETPAVAEAVKETKLGKPRTLLEVAAVPGTSGLLEKAVCSGITGMVFVKRMGERPPVLSVSAREDVEIDNKAKEGCGNE